MRLASRFLIPISICILLLDGPGCKQQPKSHLTTLDLSNHNLTSIPDSVFALSQLVHLELGNNFTIYPALSAIGGYDARGDRMNKITQVSNDIAKLSRLRSLGLRGNNITFLPKEIAQLEGLDSLDVSFNTNFSLETQLELLKTMNQLKYLNVVGTKFNELNIDELKKALPNTKLASTLMDL
jgi:Leucine-rich repeat (LRR) protein